MILFFIELAIILSVLILFFLTGISIKNYFESKKRLIECKEILKKMDNLLIKINESDKILEKK